MTSSLPHSVVVYGAYGHTGRFVVAELLRRGLVPVLSGRDPARLHALGQRYADLAIRPAAVDQPDDLRRALAGSRAVINCAGPFLDTATAVSQAAVAAGVHYLDVSAEQPATAGVLAARASDAAAAGVAVVPAMAFYGGLTDLVVTATLDGSATEVATADVEVAVGLDRWWPTAGTRVTGRRNTARRQRIRDGRLAPMPDAAPHRRWHFPEPWGEQAVTAMPFSEPVLLAHHLPVRTLDSYLTTSSLDDIRDPETPAPTAVEDGGRSSQHFVVDVVARTASGGRRTTVTGRDIYAVTAPLVVEATTRLLDGRTKGVGAAAPGGLFDAADFLAALAPEPLTLTRSDLDAGVGAGDGRTPPTAAASRRA